MQLRSSPGRYAGNGGSSQNPGLSHSSKQAAPLSPLRQTGAVQRGVPPVASQGLQQYAGQKSQVKRTSTPGERVSPRTEQWPSASTSPTESQGNASGSLSTPSVWDSVAAGGQTQTFLLPQRQGGASPVPAQGKAPAADGLTLGGSKGALDRSIDEISNYSNSGSAPATSSRGPGAGGYDGKRELTPQGLRSSTPPGVAGGSLRSPAGSIRGREAPSQSAGLAGSLRGAAASAEQARRSPPGSMSQASNAGPEPSGRMGSLTINLQQSGAGDSGTISASSLKLGGGRATPKGERALTPTQTLPARKTQSITAPTDTSGARNELEAAHSKLRELESQNTFLEKKLDEDGSLFVEALLTLEMQVEDLTKQNRKLIEEREQMERGLSQQGAEGELRARISKLEREQQDVLQEMDNFEKEKEEDLRRERETSDKLRKHLAESEQEARRKIAELERERESMIEMVALESRESQVKVEKLVREKESLNTELAKALARAEAAGGSDENGQAGSGSAPVSNQNLSEANSQLRVVMGEREALKDEVTTKNGQLMLIQSQLEIKDRKLRIADMENAMLKSELEVLRRNATK